MDKKILHQVIDAVCERNGHLAAVEHNGKTLSYGELKKTSDLIASALTGFGLQKGRIVTVYATPGTHYVLSIIAVNKAGGVFMPLQSDYPIQRSVSLLEEVNAGWYVCSFSEAGNLRVLLEKTGFMEVSIVLIDHEAGIVLLESWKRGEEATVRHPPANVQTEKVLPDGNDDNYLIYTSGSTGTPKIIRGCYKSLSHFIHWEVAEFKLPASTRIPLLAPVTFDVSFRDIFVPLLAGGTLCIPSAEEKNNPAKLLRWIREQGITLMHMVPSIFRLLLQELQKQDDPAGWIASLRHILLAGEPLPGKDVSAWYRIAGRQVQLVNLYGPSETVLAKLYYPVDPDNYDERAVVPLGFPLPNTSVIIVSGNQLCNEGIIGEILIKTPFRSKGYVHNEALNTEKFIQNPLHNEFEDIVYRTGDLGKYLAGGAVAFSGRTDNQVKIRGNRVELLEVEQTIDRLQEIDKSIVLAIENKDGEKVLACYYTCSHPVSIAELHKHLNDLLPAYMHPSYFIAMDSFPLNMNGKIDKKQLPFPDDILYEKFRYEAPATEMETMLAAIWQEVLGLRKAGVSNSFFELGGHSLSATRVISKIYADTGRQVSLRDFFAYPTIRALGAWLEKKNGAAFEQIPAAPVLQYYELSNAQKRMWLQHEMLPAKHVYNMNGSYRLKKPVNIQLLGQAVNIIISRHESLRTVFVNIHGTPMQQIKAAGSVRILQRDMQGRTKEQLESSILQTFSAAFSLEEAPLLRIELWKTDDETSVLLFSIHHIISDAWSSAVFIRELVHLYTQLAAGNKDAAASLPPLPVQYKDYVYWQKHSIASAEMQRHRDYWVPHLKKRLEPLCLPVDYPGNSMIRHQGGKIDLVIDKQVSAALREMAVRNQASLFPVMVAAIKVLLYKFCNQAAIAIGSPVVTRHHPYLMNQMGLFLNYLVLTDTVLATESFEEFVLRVQKTISDAYEHQDYPYDLLAEEMAAALPAVPLYNVLVVMNNKGLNAEEKDMELLQEAMGLERLTVYDRVSKLPLSIFLDDEDAVKITIEYSTELFQDSTILRMRDVLEELLHKLTYYNTSPLQDILFAVFVSSPFEQTIEEDY